MPLITLVKVGHITNLSDARYCAGMGVDMLGFNAVHGHLNFIEPTKYQEIRGWVTGPTVVAEIHGIDKAALAEVLANYSPDYLELSCADLESLTSDISIPLILTITELQFKNLTSKINSFKNQIAYLQVDPTESTEFIRYISTLYSVLYAPEKNTDINTLLLSLPIKGIALNGSHEIKPGLKDYDHLAEVLELLDAD